MFRLSSRWLVLALLVAVSGCSKCGGGAKPEVTGLRVTVKNAQGQPVLSRIAVLQPKADAPYPTRVTEAWVQAVTDGTVVEVAPGSYLVRAQGTGDSFLEAKADVKQGKLSDVSLGFATLILDGANVTEQGRVRVWQVRDGGQQIIVTRLVRPGEKAPIELAAGDYRVGWLKQGLTDEDANFKPFGGDLQLSQGESETVTVEP